MAQLLVDGQRVLPRRALAAGFDFRYRDLIAALDHLIGPRASRAELTEMYYNSDCPVCNAEMSHYAKLCADSQASLKFIAASERPDAFAACGLRLDHLEKRVYLKDSAGRILSGLPALIQLWARMPRYRWLARVMSLPILGVMAAGFYDHAIAPSLAYWARARLARQQRWVAGS
jgi:predicted DCC family thiol-disulfide oxidoreductase YuxK